MANQDQFVSRCAQEIGNGSWKYNMWKWGYDGLAWCATGLSWVNKVGLDGTLGYDSAAVSSVRAQRLPEIAANSLNGVQRGDLACFNWNGRTDRGWMDHIEAVEWVNAATGQFGTIGFNTDDTVKRVTRTIWASYFVCFVRPVFSQSEPKPKQEAGTAVNNCNLVYASHVASLGDCDPVRDGQQSGTTGFALSLQGVMVDTKHLSVPGVLRLGVAAHLHNIREWVDYGEINYGGYAGTRNQNRPIEAISFYEIENTTGLTVFQQVHQAKYGWGGELAVTKDITGQGSTGQGLPLEAYRLKLV